MDCFFFEYSFNSDLKKAYDYSKLIIEEQKIKNNLLRKQLEGKPEKEHTDKLYKSLRLVNNVLTVVFNDGSVVSKSEATAEDFGNIKNAASEEEILQVIGSHEANDEREKEKNIPKQRTNFYLYSTSSPSPHEPSATDPAAPS